MNCDLLRFEKAHQRDYNTALSEIISGKKQTHWMWYIFPQILGLGKSDTAVYYSIQNIDEAKAFLCHEYLGKNLIEICNALLNLETNDAYSIFGSPDNMKLQSSMTLFACVTENNKLFKDILNKFFKGEYDNRTLDILGIEINKSI